MRSALLVPAVLVPAALVLTAGAARAHPGRPPAPHDLASAWSLEPGVIAPLFLLAWLYTRGVERIWRRAGRGRGVPEWRVGCFAAGMAAAVAALVSPIHAVGAALFSGHMLQHELLMLIAAPLLVLGAPLVAVSRGISPAVRRTIWTAVGRPWLRKIIARPLAAWTLHAAALWIWHAPALYQWTLRSDLVHTVQHASFFGSAMLFWWVVLHTRRRCAPELGVGVLLLFTTALHASFLGALLTFAGEPWYPAYAEKIAAWGLTPMQDQQLGGLIMWVPFGLVYVIAGAAAFAAWLRAIEREVGRADRRRLLLAFGNGGPASEALEPVAGFGAAHAGRRPRPP